MQALCRHDVRPGLGAPDSDTGCGRLAVGTQPSRTAPCAVLWAALRRACVCLALCSAFPPTGSRGLPSCARSRVPLAMRISGSCFRCLAPVPGACRTVIWCSFARRLVCVWPLTVPSKSPFPESLPVTGSWSFIRPGAHWAPRAPPTEPLSSQGIQWRRLPVLSSRPFPPAPGVRAEWGLPPCACGGGVVGGRGRQL